jgi:hypothetical protein
MTHGEGGEGGGIQGSGFIPLHSRARGSTTGSTRGLESGHKKTHNGTL